MYSKTKKDGVEPKEFETFDFYIETDPENPYEIFNIPASVMFKAASAAGFGRIEYKLAYSHPDFKNNPVMRRYIDECKSPDYVMKMKFSLDWLSIFFIL